MLGCSVADFGPILFVFPIPSFLTRVYHAIRRFPKARVWPPLPWNATSAKASTDSSPTLPDLPIQEHLLDLYFTYVHPALPIVHKQTFLEDFRNG